MTRNKAQETIVKIKALFADITPDGISLIAVRGFFASKYLSSQRLKAMAAERAKIMQRITSKNLNKIFFHATKFVISYPQPILSLRFP